MKRSDNTMVFEIDGLCEALCIGKNTAYDLLNRGEIECFKVGSCWKIPRKSVEEYIERKCNEHKTEMNDSPKPFDNSIIYKGK